MPSELRSPQAGGPWRPNFGDAWDWGNLLLGDNHDASHHPANDLPRIPHEDADADIELMQALTDRQRPLHIHGERMPDVRYRTPRARREATPAHQPHQQIGHRAPTPARLPLGLQPVVDDSGASSDASEDSEGNPQSRHPNRDRALQQQALAYQEREAFSISDSDSENESEIGPPAIPNDDPHLDYLFGEVPRDYNPDTSMSSNRSRRGSAPLRRQRPAGSVVDLTADSPETERRNLPRHQSQEQEREGGSSRNTRIKRRRGTGAVSAPSPAGAQDRASTDLESRPRKRTRRSADNIIDLQGDGEPENENPSADAELDTAREADPNHQPMSKRTCIICMESFTNATATSCGHIYCHECLTRALKAGEKAAAENGGNGGRERGGNCPMCRTSLTRKKKGDMVTVNFMTKKRFERGWEDKVGGIGVGEGSAGGSGSKGKGRETRVKKKKQPSWMA